MSDSFCDCFKPDRLKPVNKIGFPIPMVPWSTE